MSKQKFEAVSAEKIFPGNSLDTDTKTEISRAPESMWADICRAAQEQEWTRNETRKKIRVDEIAIEPGVAIREGTDEETIQRYIDTLEKLPPIAVFHTDSKYILADGFHRWAAAVRKGWKYIEAEVKEGSLEEASEFAITANLRHGKPLTSKEYEKALRRLRVLHPNWTQEKLGETLSRSQRWVSYVLAADSVGESAPTTGSKLSMRTKSEISRAQKHLWAQISQAAQEQRR